MNFTRWNLRPLVILLALPVLLLLPAFFPGKVLLPAEMLGNQMPWKALLPGHAQAPWNPLQFDGIAQFYPWRLFAANTLKSGFIPLWNPYQFCGTPFLANDQSAVLYPLNLLFVLMPVAKAFGVSAVLHLFLTGAFLFALLRRHVAGMPALLGAIIWQLSAWQISWLALPTFLCTSTWIPLALLLVKRCQEKPQMSRGVALGAILGVMLLAGHLQVALYGLILTMAYGLMLLLNLPKEQQKAAAWSFAGAACIMLLIGAAQILPTLELARVSHRSGLHPTLASYRGYVNLGMPAARLVTLFSPNFFGGSMDYWGGNLVPYPETACFVSIAGLMLMLMALTRTWKTSREVRFFGIVALVSILIALGTPVNLIPYFGIPGFGQSGSPGRVLVLWTLSASILAGFGLQALLDGRCPKAAIWWITGLAITAFGGAVIWVQGQNSALLENVQMRELTATITLLVLTMIVAVAAHSGGLPVRTGASIIVLLCVADLMRSGFGFNPVADLADVYPATPAIAWLQSHAQHARIVVVNSTNAVYESPALLPPNSATIYGLRDIQGYDSLQTKQMKGFINILDGYQESSPLENGNMALTHPDAPLSPDAAVAGAQFILSAAPLANAGDVVAQDAGMIVYRPDLSQPRIRIATPRKTEPAQVLRDSATRIDAKATDAGDLVVADQYYPGWVAAVNGRKETVVESSEVFRTVKGVPAGSMIEEKYEPASFEIGLYLTFLGLAISAAYTRTAIRSLLRTQ